MWLGAHPGAPSVAVAEDGTSARLDDVIAADPEGALGFASRSAFGDKLPFLMKVLAAGSPFSFQVHATREQAALAFAVEDAAGIPLDAATRNYKDVNHKPEMILAVTKFEALCGFRLAAQTRAIPESLLSKVSLQPGEALFLPAGNTHAYLPGLGKEKMASSDKVLRGGLTANISMFVN